MRIEQAGAPRSITEKPSSPIMSKGDIMVSEIMDIQGDKVILKNPEGGLITARLLADIGLSVGDFVQTVVEEAENGHYVLRVLDIAHDMPPGAESSNPGEMHKGQSQTVQTAMLNQALAILKINPGADPQTAVFLSRHGLLGSADNIDMVSQMAKGTMPIANVLSEVVKGVRLSAPNETLSSPALASDTQSAPMTISSPIIAAALQSEPQGTQMTANTPQLLTAEQHSVPIQQQPMQTPAFASQDGVPKTVIADKMVHLQSVTQSSAHISMDNMAGQAVISGLVQMTDALNINHSVDPKTVGSETVNAQSAQNAEGAPFSDAETINSLKDIENAAEQTVSAPIKDTVPQSKSVPVDLTLKEFVQADSVRTQEDVNLEQIAQKALALFEQIDDADKLAAHIKRVTNEMPEQLKELKLLVDRTDISNKETLSAKLGQAEKQMSLLSDVKRFDCYQIPLMNSQQQTTADLYVYRHRNKKNAIDPENIVILLGLDTQYIGRVETLIKADGKSITLEIHLENINVRESLSEELKDLKKAVEATGYKLSNVSVSPLSARTTVLNAEEKLMKEAGGSAGNLDIRI